MSAIGNTLICIAINLGMLGFIITLVNGFEAIKSLL